MALSNKIKAFLKLTNVKAKDYSESLNLSSQSVLDNKYRRESFTAQDLIKLANLTGTRLAFIDENDKPIIEFSMDDLDETTDK